MKIAGTHSWDKKLEVEIAEYVVRELSTERFGDGQLETLSSGLARTREAFGRLVETLARKGAVSAWEVTEVVEGHGLSEARFVEEEV